MRPVGKRVSKRILVFIDIIFVRTRDSRKASMHVRLYGVNIFDCDVFSQETIELVRQGLRVVYDNITIESKDRCKAGTSVPGNALFLCDIEYPPCKL